MKRKKYLYSKEESLKAVFTRRVLIFCMMMISLLTIGSYNGLEAEADNIKNHDNMEFETLTGYLIDEHCFLKKCDDPGKETKKCLLMDQCIKGGYGVAVPKEDGTYEFYYFDGDFFTDLESLNGTGGQKKAYDYINSIDKTDHIKITVKGNLNNETKQSLNQENTEYKVFAVYEISDASEGDSSDKSGQTSDGCDKEKNECKDSGNAEEKSQTAVQTSAKVSQDSKESEKPDYVKTIVIAAAAVIVLGVAAKIYSNKKNKTK